MANSKSASYVSDAKLPDLAPPATSVGAVGWMKTNLFSSILNTVLTLASIALIIYMLPPIIQWAFIDGVWVADSRKACEAISDHGACWAVNVVRFEQLVYGFYPAELRWRPSLAFMGLMVATAPILFDLEKSTRVKFSVALAILGIGFYALVGGGAWFIGTVLFFIALVWLPKRNLMVYSMLYPIFGYWLCWGGSIWGVLLFLATLAAAYFVFKLLKAALPTLIGEGPGGLFALIGSIAALLVFWLYLLSPAESFVLDLFGFVGLEFVGSDKFGGFLLTVIIGVTGILGSLPLGIVLALGRQSDMLFIKAVCVGFIEMIRGVPLITLLFVASTLLNYFLPPGTTFDIIMRVIIMVTLFASAYMAEVIRGGLAALPKGQYEAADALGLDYNKAMRLIVMPQALKISIPGIVNTFIGLFKDTTLVSIIGLLDPLGLVISIQSDIKWGGTAEEIYILIALVFFIFCFSMSRYSMHLERKLQTGHR